MAAIVVAGRLVFLETRPSAHSRDGIYTRSCVCTRIYTYIYMWMCVHVRRQTPRVDRGWGGRHTEPRRFFTGLYHRRRAVPFEIIYGTRTAARTQTNTHTKHYNNINTCVRVRIRYIIMRAYIQGDICFDIQYACKICNVIFSRILEIWRKVYLNG